ncbi:MAG: hypothetical protein JO352_20630 [Chloroflexi bacterium]|nr:hypothetical protein [Chloroflexota bacterium]MBV9598069.1 hypothetical protein [Chloroflexota bacterium]
MSYQYLYCAACGTRRTGHGYQCSVCGGLLRHEVERKHASTPFTLQTTVRAPKPVSADKPVREPVAA